MVSRTLTLKLKDVSTITGETGDYVGTHTFRDDDVASWGDGEEAAIVTALDFVDEAYIANGKTSTIKIEAAVDGHSKVFSQNYTNGITYINTDFGGARASGTFEFYIRTTDASSYYGIEYGGGPHFDIQIVNDFFQYYAGGWHTVVACADNTWYHVRIDFEYGAGGYEGLAPDTFYYYIGEGATNGTKYGPYDVASPDNNLEGLNFQQYAVASVYIDAWGESWDPSYDVGDNLTLYEDIVTLPSLYYTERTGVIKQSITRVGAIEQTVTRIGVIDV